VTEVGDAGTAQAVVHANGLRACAAAVFERLGAAPGDAAWVADLLVRAHLGGYESHGARLIPVYARACREGLTNPRGAPAIARDDGSTVVVDGGFAFGQVAARFATEVAVERAREHGVAAVALRRSAHVGRLADYVELAAGRGVVALMAANDAGANQVVPPAGGAEGRLSTNPLAVGVPRERPPHLVVDMSTTVAAQGKVRVLRRLGTEPPVEWLAGDGLLAPLGGAKGTGLALAVEVLSGILTEAGFSGPDPGPEHQGVFLLALDPGRFLPPERFRADVEALVAYVKSSPALEPGGEVLVPGEASARTRAERAERGLPVDPVTWAELNELCAELGVAPPPALG
jgi:LDH2 family malate/lactate/ureidoglycolate dehydrogenase